MEATSQSALINRIAVLATLALLVVGTIVVLRPFVAAGLFAAVFALATWPLYLRLRRCLRGADTWAASVMTALVILLLLLPFTWLARNAIDRVPGWIDVARGWTAAGLPPPPAWVGQIPAVGSLVESYWRNAAADPGALRDLGRMLLEFGREPLVDAGRVIGEGIVQLALATFIGFFFYRDGDALVHSLREGIGRLAGALSDELIGTVAATVRGVVIGIVGTALAQGLLAFIGFVIAGVPGPLLLGGLTALLSILPGGPVLVWLGATIWLLAQNQPGWALFMAIWGVALISSIDNVLRPLLISRGASLSFAVVFVGVIGGILAFGFVGIFIGPSLLALSWRLWRRWIERGESSRPATIAPR